MRSNCEDCGARCHCITLNDYQDAALSTAFYSKSALPPLIYPSLGLAGESGELCEKVKKLYRDSNGELTAAQKELMVLELSDILWYVSAFAQELDVSLDYVATQGIFKLRSREQRGALRGSGDER